MRAAPDVKIPKIKQGAIRDSAPLEEREIRRVYFDIGPLVAQRATKLLQKHKKT